jgi:hypothetical protein
MELCGVCDLWSSSSLSWCRMELVLSLCGELGEHELACDIERFFGVRQISLLLLWWMLLMWFAMILEGGGVFERVSANSDATLKLLIRDEIVFIGGGESTEVTVGLGIVSTRIGVTVISGAFIINYSQTAFHKSSRSSH